MSTVPLVDETDELPDDEFMGGEPITIEQQARAMGWRPLEEFNGDPRRWTDAEAFVKKGLEELPVLRDQLHRLTTKNTRMGEEVTKLRTTMSEATKTVQDALRLARTANQAGYDRAMRELKTKQRAAVETGDMVEFDKVEAQIEAMETERAKVEEPAVAERPPAGDPPAPQIDPAITDFTRSNPWFFDAAKPWLKQTMISLHNAVLQEGEIPDVADQLVEAKARLAKIYPNEFRATRAPPAPPPEPQVEADDLEVEDELPPPAPRRMAPVHSPSRAPVVPNGRRRSPFEGIEDVAERAEAKAAYERMKSMDSGLTESEYMELYTNPHADALELRRQRKKA